MEIRTGERALASRLEDLRVNVAKHDDGDISVSGV
jgi:hypothetical protein